MVVHDIVPFQGSVPGIISLYQCYIARSSIVWVQYWLSYICVIWDDVGFRMGWLPFCAPWGHCDFFPVHPLTWRRFQRHCRGVFFVFPLFCGGSCVFSTLLNFTGGVDSSCRTVMLYISANFFSVAVYFSPRCGMGLDGGGL